MAIDRRALLASLAAIAATPGDVRAAEAQRILAESRELADLAEEVELREEFAAPGGLLKFVRYFWDVLEPTAELILGWPMEAICEHLEAVSRGEIKRLLINVPPGFCKSLLVNVYWPAWEWGAINKPSTRYVSFSYSAGLTERDNQKFRDVISSEKYKRLYGHRVVLRNKTTIDIYNVATGRKLASSVNGIGTGERADRILIDDPHNVIDGESKIIREETVRWFREAVYNRKNNADTAMVVIMQRVHEDDVSGMILEKGLPFCHLMIPMKYDSGRQVDGAGKPVETAIGWSDPRYDAAAPYDQDGVLAWPERFDPEEVADLEFVLGPFSWAGQYQQAPAPRGGGIFDRSWWQVWDSPDKKFPACEYIVASLDGAFTEKESNDPSGMTVWGVFNYCLNCKQPINDWPGKEMSLYTCACNARIPRRRFIMMNGWRKWLPMSGPRIERGINEHPANYARRTQQHWGLVEWVADTCRRFNVDLLLIEAKASGHSAAQELANRYPNEKWGIHLVNPKGDKMARALSVQPTFSQEFCFAPAPTALTASDSQYADWANTVIDEMAVFPKGKHDDLTDSVVQAIKYLRDTGMAELDDTVFLRQQAAVTHQASVKKKAIYPI